MPDSISSYNVSSTPSTSGSRTDCSYPTAMDNFGINIGETQSPEDSYYSTIPVLEPNLIEGT